MSVFATIRMVQEERNEETHPSVLAGRTLPALTASARARQIPGEVKSRGTRQILDSRQGADCSFGIRWRQEDFQHAVYLHGHRRRRKSRTHLLDQSPQWH